MHSAIVPWAMVPGAVTSKAVMAAPGGPDRWGRRMRPVSIVLVGLVLAAAPALGQTAGDKPPPPPAEQELIYRGEAASILGQQVRGPSGEAIGRIVDVLVDDTGSPRAAVIDFGGFMGVGNRRVAVRWRSLQFTPTEGSPLITLDMTGDQIKAIPDFKRSNKPADTPVSVAVPPRTPAATEPPAEPANPEQPSSPNPAATRDPASPPAQDHPPQ